MKRVKGLDGFPNMNKWPFTTINAAMNLITVQSDCFSDNVFRSIDVIAPICA